MNTAAQHSKALEALITRVTLAAAVLIGLAAAAALVLLADAVTAQVRVARMAVSVSFIAAGLLAVAVARSGRPRIGAAILVIVGYLSIVGYVFVTGFGARSYTLIVFTVLIIVAALLVGHRVGLWASAVAVGTVIMLSALEGPGRVFDNPDMSKVSTNNILIVYCAVFCASGTVIHLFAKSFHLTLQSVEAQERRFRQLLEVAPLGYLMVDGGRIRLANQVAAEFAGLPTPDALIGTRIEDFAPALRTTAPAPSLGQALPAIELPLRDASGRTRWVQAQTHGVESADGPAQLTVLRDITDERAAAAAMAEAKAQAEAASRAKGEFVANMSHEIRTPLNAIVGLTQLMRDQHLSTERCDDYLSKIDSASQSLLEIISDILDVSKIEAGALQFEQIDFEPRHELQTVLRLHGERAAEKGVLLTGHVSDELPQILCGDPVRLRQIINNFVGNAIKFTAVGSVEVRLQRPSHGRLRIEVQDSGIGITEATRNRLFQPFVQADSSTTRRYGGSGLGLALCRQLAQLMGGAVGVESAPVQGSVFWAELDIGDGQARQPAPAGHDQRTDGTWAGQGACVLLVEDNEVNRLVATAMLERLGLQVVTAVDGRAAVEYFAGGGGLECAAVLMDIQMPELDGCEATAILRERFSADELPIIAMTAAAFAEDRRHCIEAGMNDFIAKPFEMRRLEAVLRRWIQPGGPAKATGTHTPRSA